jgi:phenylacetate-CoA ligase
MLQQLMRTAYEQVPFYRSLMDSHGVHWTDIQATEDLSRLPVVTKSMLKAGYPDLTTRSTGLSTFEASTSGSTGTNFRVMQDSRTVGFWRSSFMMAVDWAGWQIGEPHAQLGMTIDRSLDRKLKDVLFGCHYVSARDLSDMHLDRVLDEIDRRAIRHIWGYPGSVYCLAQRALAKGWNRPIKSLVTWGDTLYDHYRQTIEKAFGNRVYDTYGCAEGIQIAAQCGHGQTYHIHSLDVIVETVDSEGRPTKPGESGNVVLTRLYAGPMPLIRYAVGDVARKTAGLVCPCRRGFETLASIEGRDTDIISTPSGNRLTVHFFTGVLEHLLELDSFQVEQTAADAIVLRVATVLGATMPPGSKPPGEVSDQAVERLREAGLQDMKIDVEHVLEIPLRASGKRRFVTSRLPRVYQ